MDTCCFCKNNLPPIDSSSVYHPYITYNYNGNEKTLKITTTYNRCQKTAFHSKCFNSEFDACSSIKPSNSTSSLKIEEKKITELSLEEIKQANIFFKNKNMQNNFLKDLNALYQTHPILTRDPDNNYLVKEHFCIRYLHSVMKDIYSYKELINPLEEIIDDPEKINELGAKGFLKILAFIFSSIFSFIYCYLHISKLLENGIKLKKIDEQINYLKKRQFSSEIQKLNTTENTLLEHELKIIKNLEKTYDYLNIAIKHRINSEFKLLLMSIINFISIAIIFGLIINLRKISLLYLIKNHIKMLIPHIFLCTILTTVSIMRIAILQNRNFYDNYVNLIKLSLKYKGWKGLFTKNKGLRDSFYDLYEFENNNMQYFNHINETLNEFFRVALNIMINISNDENTKYLSNEIKIMIFQNRLTQELLNKHSSLDYLQNLIYRQIRITPINDIISNISEIWSWKEEDKDPDTIINSLENFYTYENIIFLQLFLLTNTTKIFRKVFINNLTSITEQSNNMRRQILNINNPQHKNYD